MPYSFERTAEFGSNKLSYRIRDDKDNRVATCFDETNAVLVVMALNFSAGEPVDWICGHNATAVCAQCNIELASKAHGMAVALLESDTIEEARKNVGDPGVA